VLVTPFRVLRRSRRHDPARWSQDARFLELLSRTEELTGLDLRSMAWSRLIRVPREVLDLAQVVGDLRIDYLPGTAVAVLRLRLALKRLGRTDLFCSLIAGGHTRTTDANHALEELAEEARRTGALDTDPLPDEFDARFHKFLEEYGHRETTSPLLVTSPTWSDAPGTVLDLIRVLAAEPPAATTGDTALQELLTHTRLRSQPGRKRMLRRVEAARAGVAFREDSHFYFTKPLPVLRRSLIEIGRRLCEARVLQEPEQVFHLRLEELEAIADVTALSEPEGHELGSAARARAAKRAELAGVPLIDPARIFPAPEGHEALVAGTPAGAGIATGPVKVIHDATEFGRLEPGDVLVCPYTNPPGHRCSSEPSPWSSTPEDRPHTLPSSPGSTASRP
jgi:pyruvate,water dikinase